MICRGFIEEKQLRLGDKKLNKSKEHKFDIFPGPAHRSRLNAAAGAGRTAETNDSSRRWGPRGGRRSQPLALFWG